MLTGFAVSLLTVPFVTSLAKRAEIVDIPCERKIHIDNTPLLGGLGIFFAYIVVLFMIDSFSAKTIALIGANFLIITLGVVDDVISLNAPRKLIIQTLAVSVIVFLTDIRFTVSFPGLEFLSSPVMSIIFTYLWIILVTNALNLIDGMDGLAGGIAFMAFGAIGYAAYMKGYEFNAYLCMGLMGATLGFLRYNIPPATVFMGDTGSLFLGFNIAVMSIAASHKSGTMLSVIVPIMFISLPLFDTGLAIIRRTLKGQNPMSADKEHLHHRLLSLEFSTVQTLMIFYSLSIVLIIISIISFQRQYVWGVIIIFALLYAFFLTLKIFHLYDVGKKIRLLNEKMQNMALNISKKNEQYNNLKTRKIDMIIAFTSFVLISRFISFDPISTFSGLTAVFLFILLLVGVIVSKEFFDIKNEFISFGFFWLFFFISYRLINDGINSFEVSCFVILLGATTVKALLRRQFDLFISNPMELIILFSLLLISLFTKTDFALFFTISVASFILYYSNKSFFTQTNKINRSYSYTIVFLAVVFAVSSSAAILKSTDGGTVVYNTPMQLKTSLKNHLKAETYEQGRLEFLAYEQKEPLRIMKSFYQSEGTKLYLNLIMDSLFEGKLEQSNAYLNEFLVYFPDLADEFYQRFEPVIKNIARLDIKGTDRIMIHDIPLDRIVSVYADTMYSFAWSYAVKGYDNKSKSYERIASLLDKLKQS